MGIQDIAGATTRIASIRTRAPLASRKRHGVAVNAVAEFFRQRLDVPEIYLEPSIDLAIDVLAVDAAGSGDYHGVEIKVPNNFLTSVPSLAAYIHRLHALPLHFKWLALPDTLAVRKMASHQSLFDERGIGRIGILILADNGVELPTVNLLAQAQRFKVPHQDLTKVEAYAQKHKPDIQVRF